MLFDKIIPPDDPAKVTRWRWFIFIAVALLLFNASMGRGFMGIGAYASEHALVSQGVKIDKLLMLQLAQTLRDLKQEECRENGNKTILQRTIEDYQLEYVSVAGKRYPLSNCETI